MLETGRRVHAVRPGQSSDIDVRSLEGTRPGARCQTGRKTSNGADQDTQSPPANRSPSQMHPGDAKEYGRTAGELDVSEKRYARLGQISRGQAGASRPVPPEPLSLCRSGHAVRRPPKAHPYRRITENDAGHAAPAISRAPPQNGQAPARAVAPRQVDMRSGCGGAVGNRAPGQSPLGGCHEGNRQLKRPHPGHQRRLRNAVQSLRKEVHGRELAARGLGCAGSAESFGERRWLL